MTSVMCHVLWIMNFQGMPPPPEMMHHHHPMHAAGAPPHDLVAEFERFHLENATSGGPMHMPDQMAEFERAYQQARPMPPPPHALMHAPHMQHHMPPGWLDRSYYMINVHFAFLFVVNDCFKTCDVGVF